MFISWISTDSRFIGSSFASGKTKDSLKQMMVKNIKAMDWNHIGDVARITITSGAKQTVKTSFNCYREEAEQLTLEILDEMIGQSGQSF